MKKVLLALLVVALMALPALAVQVTQNGSVVGQASIINITNGATATVSGRTVDLDMSSTSGDVAIVGNLIQGSGTVEFTSSDFDIIGTLEVTGASTFDLNLDVGGGLDVTGALGVTGDVTLSAGDLILSTGTIDMDGFLATGSSTINGNLDVGSGIDLTGSFGFTTTLLGSSAGSVGWGTVSFANQACNTGCTTACVVGFDEGGSIVNCTSALADHCICAGAN